jgi:hypothetical protein
MPSIRTVLGIALLFLMVVLLRLPAPWVTNHLPAAVVCESPGGTVWHGQCAKLRVGKVTLPGFSWEFLPRELLHARLGLSLQLEDLLVHAKTKVLIASDLRVDGRDFVAQLPLPNPIASGMPAGWSGLLELEAPQFEFRAGALTSVAGLVRLRNLQQLQPRLTYGSFEWRLANPALVNGRISGALSDLGGPVRLKGNLAIDMQGSFDLSASAAAAPGSMELIQQALTQLGPADPEGFHDLRVAGSF